MQRKTAGKSANGSWVCFTQGIELGYRKELFIKTGFGTGWPARKPSSITGNGELLSMDCQAAGAEENRVAAGRTIGDTVSKNARRQIAAPFANTQAEE